jgi:GntR family transcriptional regulator
VDDVRLPCLTAQQQAPGGRAARGRDLLPGQKLPAERDLADEWHVGYQTVRRALRELRDRGLVASRVGKGTFIAPKP